MPAKPKRAYRKLSRSDYDSIVSLYETGASTLKELAAKYAISVGSILNQAKARGVTRRGKFSAVAALSLAAASATIEGAKLSSAMKAAPSTPFSRAATAEDRIRDTTETVYADALAIQHLIRAALAAIPAPTSAAEAAATVRTAAEAVSALDRVNRIRRTALRMDRDNADADVVLPELPITEMTDLECSAIRSEQERHDRQSGIDVPDDAPEEIADEIEVVEEHDDSGAASLCKT